MTTETLRFVLTAKDDASKVLHGMGGAFGKIQKAGMVAFGAIAVAAGAVLVVLKKSLSAYTDYMGSISAVQRLTGMSTKATSDYVGVLSLMGIAQKAGGTAVKFLGKNMDAALQGTKTMIVTFKRLGVSLKDAAGHAIPVGTVLWKVRDALAALPAGATKTALALKLFGRGGTDLMKFLAASPAQMKEYLAYIKSLGMEMGDKSLKTFKSYMEAQHKMGFAWEAVKVKIGEVLAKPLTKYFKEISTWVAAKMPMIRKWLRDAADTLAEWAPKLADIIKKVAEFTAKMWPWRDVIAKVVGALAGFAILTKIIESLKLVAIAQGLWTVAMAASGVILDASSAAMALFSGLCLGTRIGLLALTVQEYALAAATAVATAARWLWNTALTAGAVGLVLGGLTALTAWGYAQAAATSVATAAQWLWNAAMTANPIGLIIVGIGALIGVFVLLWTKCGWFRNFWIGFWGVIKKVAAAVWPVLKAVGAKIVDALQWAWDKVKAGVKWFWGWAGPFIKAEVKIWWTVIKAVFGVIVAGVRTNWAIFVAVVKTAIRAVIAVVHTIQAIVAFVRNVFNSVKKVATTIGHDIASAVGTIWRGMKSTAKTVWDGIVGVVKTAWNGIAGFINHILDAFNWVTTHVPGVTHTDYHIPTFSSSSTSTRGNGGAGSPASSARVSTPAIMDNEGMGGPGGVIGGALGSIGNWVKDLWDKFNISSHLPEPIGGLFGGVTTAMLDMVKDAIMGLLKKSGGGGMEIVNFAKSMLGVPYVWGGTSPAGFDCSGLIYWAYMQAHKAMPRVPTYGGRQISRGDIQPADVMFYNPGAIQDGVRVPFGHFKMYAGGGQTIESTTGGVQMHPADWGGAAQIRRYLKKGGAAFGPASGYPVMLHGRESVVAHDNPSRGLSDLATAGVLGGPAGDTFVSVYLDSEPIAARVEVRQSQRARRNARTRAKR